MVDGKFEFLKYWCFTFICGILCLFLTLYWQLDYGIISDRYFWHWKRSKRNIVIGDKYEKCMRQWSKSLTPKARVLLWNLQLNQGSCRWIPIAHSLKKTVQKPDLQLGYVRAGLNDFKTDLMTSNYKNIDRKLVKVNLIIITTSTLHGSSCSK